MVIGVVIDRVAMVNVENKWYSLRQFAEIKEGKVYGGKENLVRKVT